ncbi:MAG: DUF2817 domain-containing protein, partial [Alphaproteobacteria bacterium]|nr:DUF2817 domain-containing protein [Alphaproteobacteria bacterium]
MASKMPSAAGRFPADIAPTPSSIRLVAAAPPPSSQPCQISASTRRASAASLVFSRRSNSGSSLGSAARPSGMPIRIDRIRTRTRRNPGMARSLGPAFLRYNTDARAPMPAPETSKGHPMSVSDCFAADYRTARAKFLAAAAAAGGVIESIQHPLHGPRGERLYCDFARLGPPRAPRALVWMSATHGVEGHCGSGAQVAGLREGLFRDLPADTQAVLVHAINPHGFAWSRRVTEDNVDLNRNFVDHAAPYPVNGPYVTLRDAICPSDWNETAQARSRAQLDAYAKAHGPMALQQAVSGGQYVDPLGVFFGGHAPTWSNRTLRRFFARLAEHARDIAVVDFHTGLGPYGHGEVITASKGSEDGYRRACAWIGANEVTSPDMGNSSSAPLVGINIHAMSDAARGARVTAVALEYGVRPLNETLDALRADNWLHVHGELDSQEGRAIKQRMRETFYGDEPSWKRMIV